MLINDVEVLAQFIHESNREPVLKQHTLIKHTELGFEYPTFVEWNDLPEPAKEGKRDSARYLLKHLKIYILDSGDFAP